MDTLKIYKLHPAVTLPAFATAQSACFDLSAFFIGKSVVKGYNAQNKEIARPISQSGDLAIMPGDRFLIPTGMIFDIPEGWSLRIHARSGLSLKQGLILANCEAVIDSDYTHETMIMITNVTEIGQIIKHGDRIAQAEMVIQPKYTIEETAIQPSQKTDRIGGLGSTGVAAATVVVEAPVVPVKRGRRRPRKVV